MRTFHLLLNADISFAYYIRSLGHCASVLLLVWILGRRRDPDKGERMILAAKRRPCWACTNPFGSGAGRAADELKILKKHDFGRVTGWEFGWSPAGRPMMTAICYSIGHLLIDTGPSHNRKEVLETARALKVRNILLTHYHEDHSGNAAALKADLGARVYGHPLTVEKLSRPYRIFPYQMLMWGPATPLVVEALEGAFEAEGLFLAPIHTPGHSKDHVSYYVASEGWLFSGDLYLASQIKYFRADERIEDQIRSLRLVLGLDFDTLFCAHHPRPSRGKTFIAEKLQYLEDLYGGIAELAKRGLDASSIMKELGLREDRKIKWLCFGNVSMKNLVRSVIKAEGG